MFSLDSEAYTAGLFFNWDDDFNDDFYYVFYSFFIDYSFVLLIYVF